MHYSIEQVRRIAERHGLSGDIALMPAGGMVNEAWEIGTDFVLRIAFKKDCFGEATTEAKAMPIVSEAGIKAPSLVAFDLSCEIVPAPYTIYERAKGTLLGYLPPDHERFTNAYCQLGKEIARLHAIEITECVRANIRIGEDFRPWESLRKGVEAGKIPEQDAQEITGWLSKLEKQMGEPAARVVAHRDLHPWNLFVDETTNELTAIIDWGDAGIADAASDFASMPLQAIAPMIEGYRSAGGQMDSGLLARSCWLGIGVALWEWRELVGKHEDRFDGRWMRCPPEGWPETKRLLGNLFD